MKKLKKMYNKNKITFILTVIAIICILVIAIALFASFYKKGGNKYGDRLDGIEEVKLSDKKKSNLQSFYEDLDKVKKASIDISGKIIYITIDVEDGTTKAQAEGIAVKGLDEFESEELDYYDLQFIITSEDSKDSKIYPTMGYKNNTNKKVVWINRNA